MASPDPDFYSGESGGVIAGGRFRLPAWLRAQPILTWGEIPSDLLTAVDPKGSIDTNPNYPGRAPWALLASGNTNFNSVAGVIDTWCGSAYDDETGDLWLPLGGGHADSGDNAPYKLRLLMDTPTHSIVRPPSGSTPLIAGGLPIGSTPQGNSFLLDDGLETTGVYADGRPRAVHSYRKHVNVPGLGIVMAVQGGCFTNTGVSLKSTWLMDKATGEWEFKCEPSTSFGATASGACATYDRLRHCIYYQMAGTVRLRKLDLNTWTWSTLGVSSVGVSNSYIVYAEDIDRIIQISTAFADRIGVINPDTGVISYPTATGTAFAVTPDMGIDWVPDFGLVILPNTGGTVYTVRPPAVNPESGVWSWGQLATSGTPAGIATNGLWSRFGYAKRFKGLYRHHSATEKPWFLRLE